MFITALFTIARTWKQPRCPLADEWIRKLWYILHNGILFSCKKKHIWVSSNEVEEPGAYYTKWTKRKTNTVYSCMYMEFRKIVSTFLHAGQQKRHRRKEQTFGLWEKARVGWFEKIASKYVYYHIEIDHQSKLNAWNRSLKAGALGQPRGMG